ncbi:DUF72 domain-containing protein [Neptunomonas sp. XY-337]|uniref:DUF72 domain-containing protein n=1 Tax=Neptunomonas sp. XY-337 TaxID=2561897 RepID=UPI0010A9D0E4|nr:DUF72 domain-containing protein [Neptunomonas sp. XY-337]
MKTLSQKYFIGLAQWHHPEWYPDLADKRAALPRYAEHFSSVEGNNTFYGLPAPSTLQQWHEETPSTFRFCLKFPKRITHELKLRHCDEEVQNFLVHAAQLKEKVGILWLQMSHQFAPSDLPSLAKLLSQLPQEFSYGIEVRHLNFFNKSEEERAFNRLLLDRGINRVAFDTRTLFAHPMPDAVTQEALRAKPRVPLHVIATGQHPMVRFITPLDYQLASSALDQWVNKAKAWIEEGRTPYFFFHTPNNERAPQLAIKFAQRLAELDPTCASLKPWTTPQPELF